MASASHASSADEIANLLARLQTTSELAARYDSAVRNYNSSKRLLTGPSRKQIAKQCKTVGLEATFLGAQLCIDLMRLAHLLKNKGTSESDAHKKKIMNEWTRMKDEFTEGLLSSSANQHTSTTETMTHIQSEMDEYTKRWTETFYRHSLKPKHKSGPGVVPVKESNVRYIDWFKTNGTDVVKYVYNPNNSIAWTDPGIIRLVHYIKANETTPTMEPYDSSNWEVHNTDNHMFLVLVQKNTRELFMFIRQPDWIQ